MIKILFSATLTGLAIFAAGFVLGAARTFLLLPYMAAWQAALVEMPLILTACWLIIRHFVRRHRIAPGTAPRLTFGAVALVILLLCEWLMTVTLLAEQPGSGTALFLTRLTEPAGLMGLAGQLLIVVMPLWVRVGR